MLSLVEYFILILLLLHVCFNLIALKLRKNDFNIKTR